MVYIATFHTHFGAMSFRNQLCKRGDTAVMMPVPRALSASCGVCVRFQIPFDFDTMNVEDVEMVVTQAENGEYKLIFKNEE